MSSKVSPKNRIIVIANRLPVSIIRKKGEIEILPSPGGLATGLRTLSEENEVVFIGWPGYKPRTKDEEKQIEATLIAEHNCYPVFLNQREIEKYYLGFSNRTLWPLFHYFSSLCTFEETEWDIYKQVNQKFLNRVLKVAAPDDVLWVHDYHLMLLPNLIRDHLKNARIGFFLHIPFPSFEIFRILPWREEILKGVLGADLVGFHVYEYARHFLSSALRLLGYEHELGSVNIEERIVKVDNYPMGIDVGQIKDLMKREETRKDVMKYQRTVRADERKIILSVDRLDYSKGIPQRLETFKTFLTQHPEWHNKIIYMMLCVPSRTRVKDYIRLKREVDGLVGQINGLFGTPDWTPVSYMYRSLPFEKLLSLYIVADIAWVTPIRDGMNLVAKEYIAAHPDNRGVLILSGTAGSALELSEALVVNVFNRRELLEALQNAVTMPEEEQAQRMRTMRNRIIEYDLTHWIKSFLSGITEAKRLQSLHAHIKLNAEWNNKLLAQYSKADKRLLLFDYDGTLISFARTPQEAKPDKELKELLINLASNPKNTLVIVSGRDRNSLEKWIGDVPCSLVAEHGAWMRTRSNTRWIPQKNASTEWKQQIKPILKDYEARVPGSFVEEKEFGMAWHYRKADPELGEMRSCELFDNLNEFLSNTELQLMRGKKVIEVRIGGINKGEAAKSFLDEEDWDFILALGDDWTDEDIFKVLPASAYSIKIGYGMTQARFFLESPKVCRILLRDLIKA